MLSVGIIHIVRALQLLRCQCVALVQDTVETSIALHDIHADAELHIAVMEFQLVKNLRHCLQAQEMP